MKNLAHLTISLCLAAVPLYSMTVKPAMAEQILGPQDAAAHLARAHAAAEKCGYLSEAERDELSSYVNAAEVVVAHQVGSEAVLKLMDRGRVSGANMTCGGETAELAGAALAAAREAMQQAGDNTFQQAANSSMEEDAGSDFRPTLADEQQAARIVEPLDVENDTPAPVTEATLKKAEKPQLKEQQNPTGVDLGNYVRATAAYYVERRCGHLAHAQAVGFWKAIVNKHNLALATHNRSEVARAKARAESIANQSGGCGSGTKHMVHSGLSLVR